MFGLAGHATVVEQAASAAAPAERVTKRVGLAIPAPDVETTTPAAVLKQPAPEALVKSAALAVLS